jgi:hypothetical protein
MRKAGRAMAARMLMMTRIITTSISEKPDSSWSRRRERRKSLPIGAFR